MTTSPVYLVLFCLATVYFSKEFGPRLPLLKRRTRLIQCTTKALIMSIDNIIDQKDLPNWLQEEEVVYYDNDQFAIIVIDKTYFPFAKFIGHLRVSGFSSLDEALVYKACCYDT